MGELFFTAPSCTTIIWIGEIRKSHCARAAYDVFHPLDGEFDENVIVQIKYRSH